MRVKLENKFMNGDGWMKLHKYYYRINIHLLLLHRNYSTMHVEILHKFFPNLYVYEFLFLSIIIVFIIHNINFLIYDLFNISLFNLYIQFIKYYLSSIGVHTINTISLRMYTISAWYCNFLKQVIDYEKYT